MDKLNGYKGYIGYSIRELNQTATTSNSSWNLTDKNHLENFIKYLDIFSFDSSYKSTSYKTNFWIRVFTAGCYYLNEQTNYWSSYGMEILPDTNITHTHCQSNHLTQFAGGFLVLPNEIKFDQVWANASFLQNPIIYATCIALVSLYVLIAIWARYQDSKDEKKMGITLLNYQNCLFLAMAGAKVDYKYIYEIIVFTGARQNAGTDSKVRCVITSESSETEEIEMVDIKRKLFQRGAIDSFILAMEKPLGGLSSIRIWHDNSGKSRASWFLKYVIIHDLQTRDKAYFICDKWLALDKGDGSIDRVLPISLKDQQTQFGYLLSKKTKQKLSDGHLWLSIFMRPVQSAFNRLDRLTCCFVLLAFTMLMNILYYGMDESVSSSDGLRIGPYINITPQQVKNYKK